MIILASKSPRRRELLRQIDVNFICEVSNVDETPKPDENARTLVERLAKAKAQVVAENAKQSAYIIGADTIVTLDQQILGKPVDEQDGMNMLTMLSGNTHQVITAVALCTAGKTKTAVVESDVTFAEINQAEIAAYWQTGEPSDKAGAYAIQGLAAQYISHLRGSYSAVMGLPLFETVQLLKQAGYNPKG